MLIEAAPHCPAGASDSASEFAIFFREGEFLLTAIRGVIRSPILVEPSFD